jgi:putative glutathione S-transferase
VRVEVSVWHDVWYDTKETCKGHFKRAASQLFNLCHPRNWITAASQFRRIRRISAAGASAASRPRPGRYHLYVSLACPWAHRTLIFRKLKKLEDLISVSVVDPLMLEKGWEFKVGDGATGDLLFGN